MKKNRYFLYVLIFAIGGLIISEIVDLIINHIAGYEIFVENDIVNDSLLKQIILAGIFGPMLETLITQQLPLLLLRKLFPKQKYILPILITSIIFGALHPFSIYYIVASFFSGIILSFSFLWFYDNYNSKMRAFIATTFIHSFINMVSIFAIYLSMN